MNFRRVLGIAGGGLLALGALDLIAGFGYTAYSARVAANTTVSLTFYTQNPRFGVHPHFTIADDGTSGLLRSFYFETAPRWVERGVLAFDRDPGACRNEFYKPLHVFTVSLQSTRYYAITFFMRPHSPFDDVPGETSFTRVRCTFVSGVHYYRYHPQAFGPFDAVIRRSRLEYAAHPELRNLPQATFPDHDKTMLPIPIPDPTAMPNYK
jgi:hypothetical protein